MKMFQICLHSVVLAGINISFIIVGFRIENLSTHAIITQIPVSAMMCILTWVAWNLAVPYLPLINHWVLQSPKEWIGVFSFALLWSPLIFAFLHRLLWGYMTNATDILSIWLFQIPVNIVAIIVSIFFIRSNALIRDKFPTRPEQSRPLSFLANIGLAVGSGGVTILLAELVLQGFYEPPQIISGWRFHGTTFEMNQLGLRGQPIQYTDADFVIVLLGDSQVEALSCAYEWMPERRLQHYLNMAAKSVKVFSVGAGGYGQDQQLLMLKEYYRTYRADLVILWQTPSNDVWNNMFPTHWPTNGTPKPTFWLENNELFGPSEQMGAKVRYPKIKLFVLWQRVFAPIKRDTKWEAYLPQPYIPMAEYDGKVFEDWQTQWDMNIGLIRDENLSIEKSHFALSFTPRSRRMEYGIELTRRLLQKIEQLITSHQGQFYLFRITRTLPQASPADEEKVYRLNGKYYRTSEKQREANIHDINRGFQTIVVPITEENSSVGPADGHLNEHAVDRAMQKLANSLIEKIFPESQSSRRGESFPW